MDWLKKLFTLGLLLTSCTSTATGRLALIIDDVGYNQQDINALKLNGQITYSILPHTPYARIYAAMARNSNRDVMLHIPMESLSGKALGPGALMTDMNKQQIDYMLTSALLDIPFAIGINNHMGSLFTQKSSSMAWTMAFLHRHNLFFVDSKTSRFSVGEELAQRIDVPVFHRNVFLDNDLSESAMQAQFKQLIRIAQRYQYAIGIAHPYPETVRFLTHNLPNLPNFGVTLVPISSLLSPQVPPLIQLASTSPKTSRHE